MDAGQRCWGLATRNRKQGDPGSTTDGGHYYAKLYVCVIITRANISYLLCAKYYTKSFAWIIWLNLFNNPCHKYYHYYYSHSGGNWRLRAAAGALGGLPAHRSHSITIWLSEWFIIKLIILWPIIVRIIIPINRGELQFAQGHFFFKVGSTPDPEPSVGLELTTVQSRAEPRSRVRCSTN